MAFWRNKSNILPLLKFFLLGLGLEFLVFNATFNNISVISWRSVLLMEKTTDLLQVTDKLYHIMLYQVQGAIVVVIYIYLWNECLSPLTLWVRISLMWGILDTTLCDKVQWLAAGLWFSPDTPVSSTNKISATI